MNRLYISKLQIWHDSTIYRDYRKYCDTELIAISLYFTALSKREFLSFSNSHANNRGRNTKKSSASAKAYAYTDNNMTPGNLIVSTDYINQDSGGENEISMPVKLNALRYGGYSAECILDRVEPNGNIPEKEIAGK